MIIFSRLNSDKARLGNQLFRIASTIGIAIKNNQEYGFPKWKYDSYFIKPLPKYDHKIDFKLKEEEAFEYYDWNIQKGDFEIYGWLQTEKYFDKDKIKSHFTFKPEIVKAALEPYKEILLKKNILITVRRGDFINHPYYHQVSYKYYFLALIKNFPDWNERNIIFTSDDMNYCKKHFSFIKNSYFIDDSDPMIHLIIGSECDDYIISNSTFSWWIAWLGENKNSKIIRPIKNFRGAESLRKNDKDFFPDRWIKFEEKKHIIPFKFWKQTTKGNITDITLDIEHFFIKVKRYINRKLP
jgi:hypothetical protein